MNELDPKMPYRGEMISIHDLPSRKFFETKLYPLLKDYQPVLDIGVQPYTRNYASLICDNCQYYTCDKYIASGVEHIDFICDVSSPTLISLVNEKKLLFRSIIFGGIVGAGINFYPDVELSFSTLNCILDMGGLMLFSWPEFAHRFWKIHFPDIHSKLIT